MAIFRQEVWIQSPSSLIWMLNRSSESVELFWDGNWTCIWWFKNQIKMLKSCITLDINRETWQEGPAFKRDSSSISKNIRKNLNQNPSWCCPTKTSPFAWVFVLHQASCWFGIQSELRKTQQSRYVAPTDGSPRDVKKKLWHLLSRPGIHKPNPERVLKAAAADGCGLTEEAVGSQSRRSQGSSVSLMFTDLNA